MTTSTRKVSKHSIQDRWKVFDKIKKDENKEPMECVFDCDTYRDDICKVCSFQLQFTDNGFLVCSNNSCAIVYKNI